MNILVTGGSGYIGSHLVSVLRQAGHAVCVLDLRPASGEHLADPGYDFIQGSAVDISLVARAVQDVEVVCHLAWGFYSEDDAWREVKENIFGTLNLMKAALAAGVRHFLFASTAVVYGPTGLGRVSEEHPCHPERSTIGGSVYGITKLACEKLCLAHQRQGLPATIFRLHGVFSEEHLSQFERMLQQALAGQPVRAIQEAGGEYAHLEDVLRAFLLAADNPRAHGEVFNLADTHTYSDPEVAQYIVESAESESPIELIKEPAQGMISVSVDKLRAILGYEPERGEFLTALIQNFVHSSKLEGEI